VTTSSDHRTLLLLRHAKAVAPDDMADFDRPLSERGRRDAFAAGQLLASRGLLDLVLCSPAARTRETWEQAQEGGAQARTVEYPQEIYNAAGPELAELIRAVPDDVTTLLIVGHGPAVPELALRLASGGGQPDTATGGPEELLREGYPTSGLAELSLEGGWADLRPEARLRSFVVPRG
jgi:phosphohistidine phosphatase